MATVITNSNLTIDGAGIATLDSDTIVLDDANNRVGIGTTPGKKLHVYRNDTATDAQVLIEQEGTGDATIGFLKTGVYNWMTGLDNTDNKYKISGSGSGLGTNNYLSIDTDGNVIVTASFTQQFTDSDLLWTDINSGSNPHTPMSNELVIRNDAQGVTNSMASIFFRAGQTTEGLQINTARIAALREGGFITSLAFSTRGSGGHSERMRINSSGNVGIGTTSPATELDVNGTIQDAQGNVRALKRTGITSTPYALPANSSGKYFSCNTGAGTITIDAGDCETGQIITIYNQLNTDITISWTNMSSNVFIAGDTTSKGTSGSVTLTGKGLVTIINDVAARLIFSGNVS